MMLHIQLVKNVRFDKKFWFEFFVIDFFVCFLCAMELKIVENKSKIKKKIRHIYLLVHIWGDFYN